MRPSRFLAFALITAGAQAALRTLRQRARWESENKRVNIVVDYDDACAVSIRAGIPLNELCVRLRDHGATHVSLPELSLTRLIKGGRVFPMMPRTPRTTTPRVGQWMYFASAEPRLVDHVVQELDARLPQLDAACNPDDEYNFAYAGDLETIGEVGLGFEQSRTDEIHAAGLGVVPRPISYAWAEPRLIDRTLDQAARVGDGIIAFDGDLILGHEMQLRATVAALARNNLTFAYFAESRHQRGDWFIGKSRLPNVVLADRMTPAQMIPEDFHSAAHRWAMLVRERGIRLLYVNFFRLVHATEPLECLHYIEHILQAVEHAGFRVDRDTPTPKPLDIPQQATLQAGFVAAGTAAIAVSEVLNLPEPIATGITLAGAAAPFALQILDKPRVELERSYAPTYLSKILALTTALAAPIAAAKLAGDGALDGLVTTTTIDAASTVSLSALTTGADYELRVEEYRGYDLDLWLPLFAVALELPNARERFATLGIGLGAWWLLRQRTRDLLGQWDRAHAESHTHHLSASARLIGDVMLKLGPRPARRWAWLVPVATGLASLFRARGETNRAVLASGVSVLARELMLVGFRKPERALELTTRATSRNYGVGLAFALALLLTGQITHGRRPTMDH